MSERTGLTEVAADESSVKGTLRVGPTPIGLFLTIMRHLPGSTDCYVNARRGVSEQLGKLIDDGLPSSA